MDKSENSQVVSRCEGVLERDLDLDVTSGGNSRSIREFLLDFGLNFTISLNLLESDIEWPRFIAKIRERPKQRIFGSWLIFNVLFLSVKDKLCFAGLLS